MNIGGQNLSWATTILPNNWHSIDKKRFKETITTANHNILKYKKLRVCLIRN